MSIPATRIPPGVRHAPPPEISDLLAEFEQAIGARHTVVFGPDGVPWGHAPGQDAEYAQARAEQLAASCYTLTSASKGVVPCWPMREGQIHPEGIQDADHLVLRYRLGKKPWWVLVVPIAGLGGVVTEIVPQESPPATTQVLHVLTKCADRIRKLLADRSLL